jgi:hypothetical protein
LKKPLNIPARFARIASGSHCNASAVQLHFYAKAAEEFALVFIQVRIQFTNNELHLISGTHHTFAPLLKIKKTAQQKSPFDCLNI